MSFTSMMSPRCSTCLIENQDLITFNAAVNVSLTKRNYTLRFTADTNTRDVHLCIVNLKQQCEKPVVPTCYCSKIEPNGLYNIVVNITATQQFSEAEVRVELVQDQDRQVYNNTQKIPKIYSLSALNYTINGLSLQPDSNVFELQNNESTITFCCRDLPSPCRANIKHQQELVASGELCAAYNISSTYLQGSFNLTLAYDICNITKEKEITFKIEIAASLPEGQMSIVLLSLVVAVSVSTSLLIVSVCYIRAKHGRELKHERNVYTPMYFSHNSMTGSPPLEDPTQDSQSAYSIPRNPSPYDSVPIVGSEVTGLGSPLGGPDPRYIVNTTDDTEGRQISLNPTLSQGPKEKMSVYLNVKIN
ncbi:uncharacterized protein LOC131939393 [Physella acuta]|uniref:uncharacterized protein LOC131939393 n=1 Tax=Physella acuta TaxID=109671 RepID=UPI0027DD0CE3|nr:uncharacterized protein LOC131939393 [Physella acuta]